MTGLMLIGVTRAGAAVPADAPGHLRIAAGAWCGLALQASPELDLDSAEGAAAMAQAQHAVLCHCIMSIDVVPVAMGALFSGPAALRAHIRDRAAQFEAQWAAIAGRVEYTLSIIRGTAPKAEPTQSGAGHLRQRRDRRNRVLHASRRATNLLGQIDGALDGLTAGRAPRTQNKTDRVAAIDLLIDRALVQDCIGALAPLAADAATQGLHLSLSGPYPAFSFSKEFECV